MNVTVKRLAKSSIMVNETNKWIIIIIILFVFYGFIFVYLAGFRFRRPSSEIWQLCQRGLTQQSKLWRFPYKSKTSYVNKNKLLEHTQNSGFFFIYLITVYQELTEKSVKMLNETRSKVSTSYKVTSYNWH